MYIFRLKSYPLGFLSEDTNIPTQLDSDAVAHTDAPCPSADCRVLRSTTWRYLYYILDILLLDLYSSLWKSPYWRHVVRYAYHLGGLPRYDETARVVIGDPIYPHQLHVTLFCNIPTYIKIIKIQRLIKISYTTTKLLYLL